MDDKLFLNIMLVVVLKVYGRSTKWRGTLKAPGLCVVGSTSSTRNILLYIRIVGHTDIHGKRPSWSKVPEQDSGLERDVSHSCQLFFVLFFTFHVETKRRKRDIINLKVPIIPTPVLAAQMALVQLDYLLLVAPWPVLYLYPQ